MCNLFLDFSTLVCRHRVNTPTANHCTAFNTAALTLRPLLNQGRPHNGELFRPVHTSRCVDNLKGVFQSGFKRQLGQHVSCHRHLLLGSGTCLSLLVTFLAWQKPTRRAQTLILNTFGSSLTPLPVAVEQGLFLVRIVTLICNQEERCHPHGQSLSTLIHSDM